MLFQVKIIYRTKKFPWLLQRTSLNFVQTYCTSNKAWSNRVSKNYEFSGGVPFCDCPHPSVRGLGQKDLA